VENLKGRDHLEALSVEERIILKWILEKQYGLIWLRKGTNNRIL
jgi:hypothetical protein